MASAVAAMSLVACVFLVLLAWAVVKLFGLLDRGIGPPRRRTRAARDHGLMA